MMKAMTQISVSVRRMVLIALKFRAVATNEKARMISRPARI